MQTDLYEDVDDIDVVEMIRRLPGASKRNKEMLLRRCGVYSEDGQPETYAAIGKRYGVTIERVRQITFQVVKRARKHIKEASQGVEA